MGFSQADKPTWSSENPLHGESGVVEISLLLPKWQATELEREAHDQGVTTGQMVRRLIGEYLLERV
jgi:hypothetical protein